MSGARASSRFHTACSTAAASAKASAMAGMRRRYAQPRMPRPELSSSTSTGRSRTTSRCSARDLPGALRRARQADDGKPSTTTQLAGLTDEEMLIRWFGASTDGRCDRGADRPLQRARVADGSTVDEEMRAGVRFAAERVPVAIVLGAAARARSSRRRRRRASRRARADRLADDVTSGKPDPEGYLTAARAARRRARRDARLRGHRGRRRSGEGGRRARRRAHAHARRRPASAAADELIDRIDVAVCWSASLCS